MADIRVELTGETLMMKSSTFEAVLTEDNRLMILHHLPVDYDGIVLDLNGTSTLDKMLAEMYRRRMNGPSE